MKIYLLYRENFDDGSQDFVAFCTKRENAKKLAKYHELIKMEEAESIDSDVENITQFQQYAFVLHDDGNLELIRKHNPYYLVMKEEADYQDFADDLPMIFVYAKSDKRALELALEESKKHELKR